MNAKEYLVQSYRLEQRIKLHKERLEELRELASSVRSPGFEEHFNPNRGGEAPFVKTLYKVMELEAKVQQELNLLLALQIQIEETINQIEDTDEHLVLVYRYLKNMKWEEICENLCTCRSNVMAWHKRALEHIVVPDEPITIKEIMH